MSRAERRRNDRNFKKNLEVIDKLTPSQVKLIDIIASEKAKAISNIKVKEFEQLLDRNMTAAFIELDWDKDKILKFQNRIADLFLEDTEKLNKMERENVDMKKVEDTVKKAVEEVLAEGLKKKDAIDKLVFKFPKLSKSMLTNAYQNVKDTNKAVEYVFAEGDEEKKLKKELKQIKNKVKKTEVVAEKSTKELVEKEDHIPDARELEDNAGLKVLEVIKTIKVQGQNGIYTGKTGEGIILTKNNATISFSNIEELEEWVKEFKTVFNMI